MFANDGELTLFDDNAKSGKDDIKLSKSRNKRQHTDKYLKNYVNSRSKGDMLRAAAKMPQAVLKISGYCKGAIHAQKHINYITRYGKLEIVTNDGSVLKGLTAQKELINDWSSEFGIRINSRDVAKIVLSVPEKSDPNQLKKAVDEFLKSEFGNTNEYAYVLHTDTKKPHIHVAIKMVTYQGKKIDPRKNYIEKLRRDFAKCCRDNGILVEASRRYQRGIGGVSKNTPVKQMRKNKHKNIKHDHNLKAKVNVSKAGENQLNIVPNRNKLIREEYLKTALELQKLASRNRGKSVEKSYQNAAKTLLDFAKNMPTEQRFIDKLSSKIQSKNPEKNELTFQEYQNILSKLDQTKLQLINQIEATNHHQKDNKNNMEFDR